MNKKILYCIESLHNSGGMERVLTTKANYLSEHYNYDVHIALRKEDSRPFFPLSPKVICHNLDSKSYNDYKKNLTALLYEIKPNISISMCGSEFSFLYKIKDGSKKIAEFHFTKYYLSYLVNGIENLRFRNLHRIKASWIQKREARYAKHYDKVVLLTKQDLEIWGSPPNMTYIHNPLSFRSDKVSSLTNKKIVAVGRFIAQKGFLLLIEAFRIIAKKFPDWKLEIYGEGQELQLMQKRIKDYSLENQVVLCEPTNNIQDVFLQSSLFVFPSIYEGFGLVLTEAMECGVPCIAFDCECGPREIIKDRRNGYLVKNKDVESFAKKMMLLMQDNYLRIQMGKRAKEDVSSFYLENIMEHWHQLFINLCSSRL